MNLGILCNQSTGSLVGEQIRLAETSLTRMIGLLGTRSLQAGEGVWIRPSSGIHTVGMRFPIDAIGLDANLRVIRLWPALRPNRIPLPTLKVRSVVELAAGQITACGLSIGHQLAFTHPPPRPATP